MTTPVMPGTPEAESYVDDVLMRVRDVIDGRKHFDIPGEDALPRATCGLDVKESERAEEVVADLILANELVVIAGDGGSFKTSVASVIGAATGGGYRAFDRFQAKAGTVLVISEEDSGATWRTKIEAVCRGHGWDVQRVLGAIHFIALEGARLDDDAWAEHLVAEVTRLQPVLVILDPLYDLTAADENSPSEMKKATRTMRALSRPSRAAVIVVHHVGKGKDKSKLERIRGATSICNAARLIYYVELGGDGNITVECLKASRSAKLPPFVVRPHIESAPENRSHWQLARFDYASVREVSLGHAERFILAQLDLGERMTSTDLRLAAGKEGISPTDLASAQKVLEMRGQIDFEPGRNGSKLWGLTAPIPAPQAAPQLTLHPKSMQAGEGGL